ncbi:hypothetical protein NDU88_007442 [Pleurodeles waltl]|uniref:Uncharacterized protein n=1 Tax=Pleurodeles waltl TaxID=8319 RepID=A0AAV7SSV0_PLEWA|nr:hypothetical protein NDU88_007441 [Pleurodeles waltl]KAJ1167049.1 hypothetical protein NDU88_007442 [Pleurodeles waltl]
MVAGCNTSSEASEMGPTAQAVRNGQEASKTRHNTTEEAWSDVGWSDVFNSLPPSPCIPPAPTHRVVLGGHAPALKGARRRQSASLAPTQGSEADGNKYSQAGSRSRKSTVRCHTLGVKDCQKKWAVT